MSVSVLDSPALSRAVSDLLGDERAELVRPEAHRLRGGDGQGSQVFRVRGAARSHGRNVQWSLIVKRVAGDAGGQPDGWHHPEREARAYRSGLLRDLPGGLAAPRCLAYRRDADGAHCLWLEDLGEQDERWTMTTYARAARCLGRFNGAYLAGRPLPDRPWLSRDWLRRWLAETAAAVAELPDHRGHPLVRRVYPPDVATGIARLWAARDDLLAALDRLPRALCHHDAFRRNLVAGEDRIAALDWAFAGPGPVGAELSPFVTGTLALGEVALADGPELEQVALSSYVAGLRETGWDGSDDDVRFAYATTSGLRYGPGTVRIVLPVLLDPARHDGVAELHGMPFADVVDHWAAVIRAQVEPN